MIQARLEADFAQRGVPGFAPPSSFPSPPSPTPTHTPLVKGHTREERLAVQLPGHLRVPGPHPDGRPLTRPSQDSVDRTKLLDLKFPAPDLPVAAAWVGAARIPPEGPRPPQARARPH